MSWKYLVFMSPWIILVVFPRWYHLISSSLSNWTSLVFKVCLRSISQPSSLSFSDFFCLAVSALRLALFSLSYNVRSYFLPNPEGIGVNVLFYFAIAQARYFPCILAAKFVSQHYESHPSSTIPIQISTWAALNPKMSQTSQFKFEHGLRWTQKWAKRKQQWCVVGRNISRKSLYRALWKF